MRQAGDIIVVPAPEGGFLISKVLVVEPWPDGSAVYHHLLYQPVPTKPTLAEVSGLTPLVLHAPIDGAAADRDAEFIGNLPVTEEDLVGYREYRRLTGTDDDRIARAQEQYLSGNALAEAGRHEEAIEAYHRATDEVPAFWEARDNAGFSRMSLGQWEAAIAEFEQSLQAKRDAGVGFDDPAADFSIGECLLRLGRFDEAVAVFRRGAETWPDEPRFAQCLTVLEDGTAAPGKPWWKFWR